MIINDITTSSQRKLENFRIFKAIWIFFFLFLDIFYYRSNMYITLRIIENSRHAIFILKPIGHFIYLFIYFAPYVVRHLRTTIIRGDRTRRWQWSVYVTKRKKKKKEEEEEEEGEGGGERGRRGGVEEEETREERRFTNGQQLAVYSFGHGFLDTGLDRCYQPIYQNRSVLLYSSFFFLPPPSRRWDRSCSPFPFRFPSVAAPCYVLYSPWTGHSTCWITYRQNLFFTLRPNLFSFNEWTSFFVII